jgi:hypothetical protein
MPLKLPDNKSVDYFISGVDDHKMDGAVLGAGQTCTVTSSDPLTVALTPDATPRNAPDGSVSIASGKAAAVNPVGNPNVAVSITSHIAEADGTPGKDVDGSVIADAVDTITVVPGALRTTGVLFGVPA